MDVIEEQLQMYVSRKEQTLELKREYPTATVRSNAAYNFVHISVPYKNKFASFLALLAALPVFVRLFPEILLPFCSESLTPS